MDYNIIFLIVGVIIAAGGVIGTQFYYRTSRKDKVVETRQSLQADVEQVARTKFKEEQQLAGALASNAAALALNVKQDMKDHIDRLVVVLKQDVEMQRILTYSKMEGLETRIGQLKIDLMEHILNEKDERIRMQKSIDFFQTMQYGPDAKSIPDYILGEEESEEHKEQPDKGVFASRADTTDKDTKDPTDSEATAATREKKKEIS